MKHFRSDSAKPYDLDTLTPDDFLVHQLHFNEELLMEKLVAQAVARGITLDALRDGLESWAPSTMGLLR